MRGRSVLMSNLMRNIKHICRCAGCILIWFTLSLQFTPLSAQTDVTVYQPVSGSFVRNINTGQFGQETGIVDVGDGIWSLFQTQYLLSAITHPLWSPNGQEIAFGFVGKYAGTVDFSDTTITFTTQSVENALNTPFEITFTRGWSADERSLTITYGAAGLNANHYLANIDLENNTVQEIRRWQADQQVTDMPLPPNVTSVTLEGESHIQRNPVFDDWIWMHFAGRGFYSNLNSDEPRRADINVLWNFRTNEYISLDALVPDLWLSPPAMDWSHDGTRLLLRAISQNRPDFYIVNFHFTPDEGVTLVERAIVEKRIPDHWLDAGSLFFSRIQGYEGGAAYVLGEIVNGEYRETPFFTLNGDQFQWESLGDWFMRADDAERDRLSCLFEWSLPTQLEIGDSPEVVSAEGLTLRSRSDRFSSAIQTLTQGTVVTVIGGDACSDGYRWWQVRLSDGTEGFVAEASTDEYFIEPVVAPPSHPSPNPARQTPTPSPSKYRCYHTQRGQHRCGL